MVTPPLTESCAPGVLGQALHTLAQAPKGLYPLRHGRRIAVTTGFSQCSKYPEGVHRKIFTLYSEDLFGLLGWLELVMDPAYKFHQAMRIVRNAAKILTADDVMPDVDRKEGSDFEMRGVDLTYYVIATEAVRLLAKDIVDGLITEDGHDTGRPWDFLPRIDFEKMMMDVCR